MDGVWKRLRTNRGETVQNSGRDDNQQNKAVAIILRKGTGNCLMEWKAVNSRLMKDQGEMEADQYDDQTVLCSYK